MYKVDECFLSCSRAAASDECNKVLTSGWNERVTGYFGGVVPSISNKKATARQFRDYSGGLQTGKCHLVWGIKERRRRRRRFLSSLFLFSLSGRTRSSGNEASERAATGTWSRVSNRIDSGRNDSLSRWDTDVDAQYNTKTGTTVRKKYIFKKKERLSEV